jgi:hypothetical protein
VGAVTFKDDPETPFGVRDPAVSWGGFVRFLQPLTYLAI